MMITDVLRRLNPLETVQIYILTSRCNVHIGKTGNASASDKKVPRYNLNLGSSYTSKLTRQAIDNQPQVNQSSLSA